MAHIEGAEGHNDSEQRRPPIEITVPPHAAEQLVFERSADGGYTIFLRGDIRITVQPPVSDAAESPVTPTETASSGLVPDTASPPVTEPHSVADKPSWEQSRSDIEGDVPESENRKFQLIGNPAKKLGYRVTRKSNTRIADFVLATHPDTDTTEYWRIRAFGDQAEKVRDQVEVGQKGVEVTVYGPKYWHGRKKTKDGWEETVVKGYHAGFVKVPRKYRSQEQPQGTAEPKPEN